MKRIRHKIKEYLINNFAAEQSQFLVLIPFLFALGIAIYFSLPFEPNIWIGIIGFEIWLLIFYLCRFKNLHLFFIAGIIVFAGYINISAHSQYRARHITHIDKLQTLYLKGTIVAIEKNSQQKTRLLLDNAADYDGPLKGKFRITVDGNAVVSVNDCVEMVATLFPPHPLPILNGFKLDQKYFYSGISATGYANSEIFKISCLPADISLQSSINFWRKKIADKIDNAIPQNESGVANALLIGEKSYISRQIAENYRNSGLAHVLSVSGLHLGTIAGLIFFAIRFLLALFPHIALNYDIKKIAAVFAIIFSALYLLISGMAVPAQRAFIMTTVVFIGILFNRQAISVRMVSFAAIVILLISPQALVSISFQMSFAAVYALVAFYEAYAQKIAAKTQPRILLIKIFYYWLSFAVCSFVAGMATAPFSLYHFHKLAVYTCLSNALAGPLIALWIMPMVLVCLAASIFGLMFYPLKFLGYGIFIMNQITLYIADLPHSVWYEQLPLWGFIFIVIGGFWLCIWQQKWRKLGLIAIIIGLTSLFFNQPKPDFIVAPEHQSVAFLNNDNQYVMMQFKSNNFLKSVWQENFRISEQNIHKLRSWPPTDENLACNEEFCLYKDKIKLAADGKLWYEEQPLSAPDGGYIYLHQGFVPMQKENVCRLWNKCKAEKHK